MPRTKRQRIIVYLLFFASGTLGLVYEVLWLKELQLLFGNTAYATATTLTVFFLGLSAGGYYWGGRSTSIPNLLRTYGLLEIGVGLTAVLYFLLLALYRALYPGLFEIFGNTTSLFVLAKFLLSLSLLFLPAFLMGGTLPLLSQYLVRRPFELGSTGASLYAVNTAGGVVGVLLAGFVLPPLMGYTLSYVAAILSSGLVGLAAVLIGTGMAETPPQAGPEKGRVAGMPSVSPSLLYFLAFASGFQALALQVLWNRMFSQVLQNTVYTFSAILVVFLVALAVGAALASLLAGTRLEPVTVLVVLLALAGLSCSAAPALFYHLSQGLDRLLPYETDRWTAHLLSLFRMTALIIFVPGILLGSVFPYLMKVAEGMGQKAGPVTGRILSANTFGAILGSLGAGFFLLGQWGLWKSLKAAHLTYLFLALLTAVAAGKGVRRHAVWLVGSLGVALYFLGPGLHYPLVHLAPDGTQELVGVVEGSHAVASAIKYKAPGEEPYTCIFLNNKYSLGGTKPLFVANQRAQTVVPMNIHPGARSLFYLGMGTGITAAKALRYDVDEVTVCELVPEVVQAARLYLGEYVSELFDDPRATVVIEDGRNYLLGKKTRYDLIIGDLFLPWKTGIGNLYSVEHFATVKSKLNEEGLFVQWLALYQLSRREFSIIVHTMLQSFERVTLWRNSFLTDRPTMALIGHSNTAPLRPDAVIRSFSRLEGNQGGLSVPMILANTLMLYAGNLRQAQELFSSFPVNTDDRPLIEFSSPRSYQHRMAGKEKALTEQALSTLLQDIFKAAPPEKDPYLTEFDGKAKAYPRAGADLHRMGVSARSDREEAERYLSDAIRKLPPEFGHAVEKQHPARTGKER